MLLCYEVITSVVLNWDTEVLNLQSSYLITSDKEKPKIGLIKTVVSSGLALTRVSKIHDERIKQDNGGAEFQKPPQINENDITRAVHLSRYFITLILYVPYYPHFISTIIITFSFFRVYAARP